MTKFVDLLGGGLTSGAIYAVFALTLTCLFRVSGILNLAVGDFAMLGALGVSFFVNNDHFGLAAAIAIDLALVAAFACAYDVVVLRMALEGKRAQDTVLVLFFFTFGLSFFIEGVGLHLFGTNVGAAPPLWPGAPLGVGSFHLQRAGILVISLAIIIGVGFTAFLRMSLRGKAMAACGENPLGARIVGIKQPAYRRGIFISMAVLAAIFGIVESPLTGFVYNSGGALGLTGLIAAAFAGFIRPGMAVIAGVLIGLLEAFLGGYVSTEFQETLLYAVLVVIILARPQLLGGVNPVATTN